MDLDEAQEHFEFEPEFLDGMSFSFRKPPAALNEEQYLLHHHALP